MVKCNATSFSDIVYEVFYCVDLCKILKADFVLLELWTPEDGSVKFDFAQF